MSLVGQLEDLSLSDIAQIVFLSRRSGKLQIETDSRPFRLVFRQGLIVAAAAPDAPGLAEFAILSGALSRSDAAMLLPARGEKIPFANAVLDWNLLSREAVAQLVREWIATSFQAMLGLGSGRFHFELAEASDFEIGYDPESLLGRGGFQPDDFLPEEGGQYKPLAGLEESVLRGKELLRRGQQRGAVGPDGAPVPQHVEAPLRDELDPAPDPRAADLETATFRIRSQSDHAGGPQVLLFDPDARGRVAVRRHLSQRGIEIQQYGRVEEARAAAKACIDQQQFFITIAVLPEHGALPAARLLGMIKETNPRLPVAVVGGDGERQLVERFLDMRHDLMLTAVRGSEGRVSGMLEELAEFVARRLGEWRSYAAAQESAADAAAYFYERARSERLERKLRLVELLIVELFQSSDVESVAMTILRVGSEFVDRCALFLADDGWFSGIAGSGPTGDGDGVSHRIKGVRIPKNVPSVLNDVYRSVTPHRGKLRPVEANVMLLRELGSVQPTEVAVFPITNEGRVVGLFYADNAIGRNPIRGVAGLEVFLRQAGSAVESALLREERKGD